MDNSGNIFADANGLTVRPVAKPSVSVKWGEVLVVTAFKVDQITVAQVRVRFDCVEKSAEIDEDMAGFEAAMKRASEYLERFPEVSAWKPKVVLPPFAPSITELWRKRQTNSATDNSRNASNMVLAPKPAK